MLGVGSGLGENVESGVGDEVEVGIMRDRGWRWTGDWRCRGWARILGFGVGKILGSRLVGWEL